MRGEVLEFDGSTGLIAGADGNRYRFAAADLRRQGAQAGSNVDFLAESDVARDIFPLGGAGRPAGASYAASASTSSATSATSGVPVTGRPSTVPPATPPRDRGLLAYFFHAATDNYANFHGRARRKEYWGYTLFYAIFLLLILGVAGVGIALSHLDPNDPKNITFSPLLFIGSGVLSMFSLGLIVPSIAVAVRRLHDIGRSGWWLLLHFVPGIGQLVLFIMSVLDSQPAANEWGPPVKAF